MYRLLLTLLLALTGCTSARVPSSPTQVEAQRSHALRVTESAALHQLLVDQGAHGVIAVLRGEDSQVGCSDPALCQKRALPASTFKIPNALIGLETGV
ncbi:MAG: Beta-lactamase, partial [Myxococcaceae bacterium]|nr:Beta-lactamase [Myxococcaceae bacterium]